MPVTLPVSQVRAALYQAVGGRDGTGTGSPSTAVLGQWFHQVLEYLVDDSAGSSPLAQLDEIAADLELWKRSLAARAYTSFLGPRLVRERAALHEVAPQVLSLWQAVQAACDWLAELNWRVRGQRPRQRIAGGRPWTTLADWLSTEESLASELREPGWSDSVRLTGVADAVIRLADTGAWCAVEFKLGQTSPVADLGQACLYHLMIAAAAPSAEPSSDGTLAVVSFRPERHEQLFSSEQLREARQQLLDVIGKLAGVDPAQRPQPAKQSHPAGVGHSVSRPAARRNTVEPSAEHLELGRGLVAAWAEHGIQVTLDHPVIAGPTFVRFPITLGRGTKVNAVVKHAPELQVRLGLREEPFIFRDGGQLVVDVQRSDRQTVTFDDIRHEIPPADPAVGGSRVPLGVNLFRQLECADLSRTEHCHMLVVGTTGSGKSEWLRLALAGLILTNAPETLRLLVIDPKRNAFHALRESPYLWRPIVFPDEQSPVQVLTQLAEEMDRRYKLGDGADNFAQMKAKTGEPLPRIVCVCDEYRDLISRDKNERKEIEAQIFRLGAKARAAGIHLILATQEASRDTIRGALDSNMPARVGLKMAKNLESRMLLSDNGAEKLLGHGDLLFKDVGSPRRLQAPLLSEANRLEIFGIAAN